MDNYPHQFTAPEREERRRSRNCLRVDFLSDGTPEPRCNLKPLDDMAVWLLDNRPWHVREHSEFFGRCTGAAPSCDACAVYQRTQFRAVDIRVYQAPGGLEVTTLGRCTWYALYTASDIAAIAAWVERHGGGLGATGEDQGGRYRAGFVNWWQIPEGLRP
jgi:hypothetical protein